MGLGTEIALIKALGGGSALPPITAADNGKVLTANSGVWGASLNQVEILADYDPATGIMTQRQGADVPTVDELNTAFTHNGAVRMRVFVNGHQVSAVYLYPLCNEVDGILFGTVLSNRNEDYDESINVFFYANDDDVVAFTVNRSLSPKGRFIVTLTPTSADYSGTMDKTVAEINAAYEAGQEIVFKVITGPDMFVEVPCSAVGHYDNTGYYPDFIANIIQYGLNAMIVAYTEDTRNGTKQTYSTKVYTLTPAT